MIQDTRYVWAAMIPSSFLAGGGGEHSPNFVQLQFFVCLPPSPRLLRRNACLDSGYMMYELTSGKFLRIQRNSWFHVQADSDPEVGCCHGVPLELDQDRMSWRSNL